MFVEAGILNRDAVNARQHKPLIEPSFGVCFHLPMDARILIFDGDAGSRDGGSGCIGDPAIQDAGCGLRHGAQATDENCDYNYQDSQH